MAEMKFRTFLRLNFWRHGSIGQLGRVAWRRGFPNGGERRGYLNFLAREDQFDLAEVLCQQWDDFWERQFLKEADRR